jgi:predicted metalloprotease with PDZ domain
MPALALVLALVPALVRALGRALESPPAWVRNVTSFMTASLRAHLSRWVLLRLLLWVPLCASLAPACARDSMPTRELPRYGYEITPPAAGSWILRVVATFERAPSPRLVAGEADPAMRDVGIMDGGTLRPLERAGGAWIAVPCRARCTIHYSVDLGALAGSCRGFDCARRVGDAIISPSATWLLCPASSAEAIIDVTVRGGDADRFSTGLRHSGHGGFEFRGNELGESSYSAFGTMRRHPLVVAGATLDVAFLGSPLSMGDEATLRWIGDSASCVARLFGRFPVNAAVFVVPVPGADDVVFGRVMSLTGASVVLLFGTETPPESDHQDWVVVHELLHLGTPSFVAEGHWLEEGLATYYEPVLRTRAGWMREVDLWRHFAREMRRGLRRQGEARNLEERDDIDSVYWGGALFALLADVRIRQATAGAHSLDDVMRAALALEGDATHVARVADFVRVGDVATEHYVLADLFARYVVGGGDVDLDALLRSLGVVESAGGEASLRDDAPMSAIRHGISSGTR